MTSALKGIQPSFGIVVSRDLGARPTPSPADAYPHVRMRLNIAYPSRVTSLLGHHPADVTGGLHPDHLPASGSTVRAIERLT
jgi:hypothetical protein